MSILKLIILIFNYVFFCFNQTFANVVDVSQLSSSDKCIHIYNSYPGAIARYDIQLNQVVFLNGHILDCDKGMRFNLKNDEEYQRQMANVDLSDILLQGYPQGYVAPIYEKNYSPGRFRNDQLFINTYININSLSNNHLIRSANQNLVEDDLKFLARYLKNEIVKVKFLGFDINMNQRNGAASALARVGQKLEKDYPEAAKWLKNTRNMSGGYNMRFISGTNRLSSHSWGIAVDFTLKNATTNLKWFDSYWKWVADCTPTLRCSAARTDKGANERRDLLEELLSVEIYPQNFDHFPPEIVQVFAEEGFIWGGHWHHFDTMHFEYRPEFFY